MEGSWVVSYNDVWGSGSWSQNWDLVLCCFKLAMQFQETPFLSLNFPKCHSR
jgi:hypothetical protein